VFVLSLSHLVGIMGVRAARGALGPSGPNRRRTHQGNAMPTHVDPPRMYRYPRQGTGRRAVEDCLSLLDQLNRLDGELAVLAARRRQLLRQLRERRNHAAPRIPKHHGRRPKPDGTAALPPAAHRAVPLYGTALRDVCVSILRRCGVLALPEIHAMIHHLGYRIESKHAVKTLSDALAYEHEQGRARRVERGTYAPVGPPDPHAQRPQHRPCQPLDHLPETLSPQAA
jgi:hypothetical protein